MPSITDIVDDQLVELGLPRPKYVLIPPAVLFKELKMPTPADILEPPVLKMMETVKRKVTQ